ncbi:MAG: mechanosensitive ion channel family protein [Deltaproteobacteria bacterium]|nr:mechanosensitive ion channel family protein [Deltaproteobacteria bacterium]
MNSFFEESVETITALTPESMYRTGGSIAALIALFLTRLIINYIIRRRIKDVKKRYNWHKTVNYTVLIMSLLMISRIWITGLSSFINFLGLVGAGLVIALREPVQSLFGLIFILWRKPYSVGDRIEVANKMGDVVDIGFFRTTLLEVEGFKGVEQSSGRLMEVPNNFVFSHLIFNSSQGFDFIWNEITLRLSVKSDWKKGIEILEKVGQRSYMNFKEDARSKLNSAGDKFLIFYHNFDPKVYLKIKRDTAFLTLRFLCPPRQKRDIEDRFWKELLDELSNEKNIELK